MARPLAVPLALPDRRAPRASPLGVPQYMVLLAGLLLAPLFLVAMFYPLAGEHLARRDVLAHGAAFGFEVGEVPTEQGYPSWGITGVAPLFCASVASAPAAIRRRISSTSARRAARINAVAPSPSRPSPAS